MTKRPLSALVICSDDLANVLAQVLEREWRVYLRQAGELPNTFDHFEFTDGEWTPLEVALPGTIDVLFLHLGMRDPDAVPPDVQFRKEFAFSTGGASIAAAKEAREFAVPVRRAFREDTCPLTADDLQELSRFVTGVRTQTPAFCEPRREFPALEALAILCQTYIAAAAASGHASSAQETVKKTGWDDVASDVQEALGAKLSERWTSVQTADWWKNALGATAEDDSEFVVFLEQLYEDLELPLPRRTPRTADAYVGGLDRAPALKDLLSGTPVSLDAVDTAYTEIATQLAAR